MVTLPPVAKKTQFFGKVGDLFSEIYIKNQRAGQIMWKGVVIDLFAGLGGASQAFMNGEYRVERFDNNPLLKDVEHMHMFDFSKEKLMLAFCPKVMIAAPPCLEFSQAYSAPAMIAKRDRIPFEPSMAMLEVAIEHRDRLAPQYWIIENVIGSIPFFEPYLGAPTQIIGPFVLWHNCPHLVLAKHQHQAIKAHKANNDQRWSPIRSNHKAKWPISLSEALLRSVEQPTLQRWV